MHRFTNQSGMNYIQMLLVLVLGGIIGAIVVPYLSNKEEKELRALARQKIELLAGIQEQYYTTHGEFTMEIDSLMTILPDTSAYIDPLTGRRFTIGTVNQGQDYSIQCPGDSRILIVTEDRWEKLQEIRQAWHEYQQQLRAQGRRRL